MAESTEQEQKELLQIMSDMERHAIEGVEPGSVPIKDVFQKTEKKKPKLLVNHLVDSIRVGDRTKMMLKDSQLGRTSMELDSLVEKQQNFTMQQIRERIDSKT